MKLSRQLTPRDVFQKVTISGSHAESSAFAATTKVIRVVSTVDCYLAIGTAPAATSSSLYMVAGTPEFFGITPGVSEKVSVLQVSGGGTLSIAEGEQL